MNYDSLEKDINNGLKPVYLLYGTEQYLIETAVRKIKKSFSELVQGINYILIDETNISELISNIEMPAFGYDKKLIIVKNSGIFKKDGRKKTLTPVQERIYEFFTENYEIIEDSVTIVFVEKEIDKNQIYEIIEKRDVVCEVNELKPNQLAAKLSKVCALYKVNIESNTLNYFIEMCGTSLQNLINEIRKLIEYAGEGGTITIDAVNKLSIKQIDSVIFELTDNLATKKIDKALEVLDNLIYQKEPVQKILITLYNHFKKLYLCSLAVKFNKDIVNTLNLKPNQAFLITKYKKQCSYFKQNELRNILDALVELDYNSKNGKIDVDIGLRSILCNYCS